MRRSEKWRGIAPFFPTHLLIKVLFVDGRHEREQVEHLGHGGHLPVDEGAVVEGAEAEHEQLAVHAVHHAAVAWGGRGVGVCRCVCVCVCGWVGVEESV